jgi:hypothetical protein
VSQKFYWVRKTYFDRGVNHGKIFKNKIKPLQACGLSAVLALGFGASSVNAQSGEEIDEIIVTGNKKGRALA